MADSLTPVFRPSLLIAKQWSSWLGCGCAWLQVRVRVSVSPINRFTGLFLFISRLGLGPAKIYWRFFSALPTLGKVGLTLPFCSFAP